MINNIGRRPLNTNFGCTLEIIMLINIKLAKIKYPEKFVIKNKLIIIAKQLNIFILGSKL
jgi:hypothetical protein